MPIKTYISPKNGAVTPLKYWLPNEISTPLVSSDAIGAPKLPQKMAKNRIIKTMLFKTNIISRLKAQRKGWSSSSSPRFQRMTNKMLETNIIPAQNRNIGTPIGLRAKLCTLSINPLRVAKVPKITEVKVAMMRNRFHFLSMPRRSCTITLCKKAVPINHGRNAAFSTGSQPQ